VTSLSAARQLLDVAVAGLTAAGRTVPGRVLVTPGSHATAECEQITVAVTRPSIPGPVAQEVSRARAVPQPRYVELRLDLLRCIPIYDEAMDPTEAETYAGELLADADALLACLTPEALTGRPGRPAYVGPVSTQGPEGGMVGLFCVVQVPL
jgi:hypothetical protein